MLNTVVLDNELYIRVKKCIKGPEEGSVLIGELEKGLSSPGITKIIIDLSETYIVDSVFINSLVRFKNQYPGECDRIEVYSRSAHITDLLKITKLDQIFKIRSKMALDRVR